MKYNFSRLNIQLYYFLNIDPHVQPFNRLICTRPMFDYHVMFGRGHVYLNSYKTIITTGNLILQFDNININCIYTGL